MIRISHAATLLAVSILGATAAQAEILNVSMTAQDPALSSFSLSFDVDTAATTNTIALGACPGGTLGCAPPDVYTTFSATGGISNALLTWQGKDYGLTASNIFLDWQGGTAFDLDMHLNFDNSTQLLIDDQPTGGPYSSTQYAPSQLLTSALLTSYNGYAAGAFSAGPGGSQGTFLDGLLVKTTPVTTSVPEPDTLALLSVSLAGMIAVSFSRRRMAGKAA